MGEGVSLEETRRQDIFEDREGHPLLWWHLADRGDQETTNGHGLELIMKLVVIIKKTNKT